MKKINNEVIGINITMCPIQQDNGVERIYRKFSLNKSR